MSFGPTDPVGGGNSERVPPLNGHLQGRASAQASLQAGGLSEARHLGLSFPPLHMEEGDHDLGAPSTLFLRGKMSFGPSEPSAGVQGIVC